MLKILDATLKPPVARASSCSGFGICSSLEVYLLWTWMADFFIGLQENNIKSNYPYEQFHLQDLNLSLGILPH
jgi:hypothetical protein